MKQETLHKLAQLTSQKRLQFEDVAEGLAVNHDLSDEEMTELVHLEYGETSQSKEELFKCICKKLVKSALEKNDVSV